MCERLPEESRLDMLGRLYHRAQIRADLEQLRRQQAESRASKAEWVADRALSFLAEEDAALIQAEAEVR